MPAVAVPPFMAQPLALPVLLAVTVVAEPQLIACAAQPPSAGTAGVVETWPFDEATTAFVVVADPALAVLAALFWASHAWAVGAVQANATAARASSRSDFMDPTSRKVMTPRHSLVSGSAPHKAVCREHRLATKNRVTRVSGRCQACAKRPVRNGPRARETLSRRGSRVKPRKTRRALSPSARPPSTLVRDDASARRLRTRSRVAFYEGLAIMSPVRSHGSPPIRQGNSHPGVAGRSR